MRASFRVADRGSRGRYEIPWELKKSPTQIIGSVFFPMYWVLTRTNRKKNSKKEGFSITSCQHRDYIIYYWCGWAVHFHSLSSPLHPFVWPHFLHGTVHPTLQSSISWLLGQDDLWQRWYVCPACFHLLSSWICHTQRRDMSSALYNVSFRQESIVQDVLGFRALASSWGVVSCSGSKSFEGLGQS